MKRLFVVLTCILLWLPLVAWSESFVIVTKTNTVQSTSTVDKFDLATGLNSAFDDSSFFQAESVAIDPISKKLYMHSQQGGGILRSNLDGSGLETFFVGSEHALDSNSGIAINPLTRKLYFPGLNQSSAMPAVYLIDIDDTSASKDAVLLVELATPPRGLTVNAISGDIFFIDTINSINRSTGDNVLENIYASPEVQIIDIVVHPIQNKLYMIIEAFSGDFHIKVLDLNVDLADENTATIFSAPGEGLFKITLNLEGNGSLLFFGNNFTAVTEIDFNGQILNTYPFPNGSGAPLDLAVYNSLESSPDNCPNDPIKTEPGDCGCGTPDTDSDGNGTPDCQENGDRDGGEPDVIFPNIPGNVQSFVPKPCHVNQGNKLTTVVLGWKEILIGGASEALVQSFISSARNKKRKKRRRKRRRNNKKDSQVLTIRFEAELINLDNEKQRRRKKLEKKTSSVFKKIKARTVGARFRAVVFRGKKRGPSTQWSPVTVFNRTG